MDKFESLQDMILRHEGLRLKPYRCPAGKLTIGVGRNIEDNGITKSEARVLLDNDIDRCIVELWDIFHPGRRQGEDLHVGTAAVENALLDLLFNIGKTRFLTFKKMIAAIKARDYGLAADELLDSRYATQVPSRAAELAEMIRKGRDE